MAKVFFSHPSLSSLYNLTFNKKQIINSPIVLISTVNMPQKSGQRFDGISALLLGIAVWILPLPVPTVAHHVVDTKTSSPSQFGICFRRIAIASGNISGTTRFDTIRNLNSVDSDKGLHHIKHRISVAGTYIKHTQPTIVSYCFKGCHMCIGQITHMDIITYTCSVGCRIVVTEHTQFFTFSNCHLGDIRHQIVWYSVGILSYFTTWMGSDRIKIAQQYYIPFRVSLLNIGEYLFEHALGPSIRIGALPFGALLGYRNLLWITVYCGTTAENDIFTTMMTHHIDKSQCASYVIFIIFPWLFNTFTYSLEPGKMDTGIACVGGQYSLQSFTVANIDAIEWNGYFFIFSTHYILNALKRLIIGIGEIVNYHSSVTCFIKFYQCVRAYESGSASD